MVSSRGMVVLILKQLQGWITFLSPTSGRIIFLGVFQCALSRIISDHCPISLEGGGVKKGKTPFRFENMWLLSDGFKELVKVWWPGYSVAGSNNHCLAEKLKALKRDLRRWKKEVFGNVSARKSEAFSRI